MSRSSNTRNTGNPSIALRNLGCAFILFAIACVNILFATEFFDNVLGPQQPTPLPTPVPSRLFSDPVNTAACAPDAVRINLIFALNPQQNYMTPAIDAFNAAYAAGRDPLTDAALAEAAPRICVTGRLGSSSRTSEALARTQLLGNTNNLDVLPTLFAPSVSTWLTLANFRGGSVLFPPENIQDVALTPMVLAIWQSRLQALQTTLGREQIGWGDVLAVFESENGWRDYGLADGRRAVYYGQTDPRTSSTGLSALTLEFYAAARAAGINERRLSEATVNDAAVQAGVRQIEQLVRHYAPRTDNYLDYIAQGPDYLDLVPLEEVDLLYLNGAFADQGFASPYTPPEPLVALYPSEGTLWHERPVGLIDADWVTAEQAEAARVFMDYLVSAQVQADVLRRGFRPVNPQVEVGYPLVPENGVQTEVPVPLLAWPDAATLVAMQQSWRLVKKQADVLLLIDVSGSMGDDDKLVQAQAAATAFINDMADTNRLGLVTFNNNVTLVQDLALLEANRDALLNAVNNLNADGGTELYKAVADTVTQLARSAQDADRIRAVVLLSDGEDTGELGVPLAAAINAIESTLNTPNPVLLIPLAYGSGADVIALADMARASATRLQSGDPADIGDVLDAIRQYF